MAFRFLTGRMWQPAGYLLEIPDYYAENAAFCFGKLFSDYVSGEKTEELTRKFPEVCEELEKILHQKDGN